MTEQLTKTGASRGASLDLKDLYAFDARGLWARDHFLDAGAVADLTDLLAPAWPKEARHGFRRIDDLARLAPELAQLAERAARELGVYDLINQPFRLIESYALHREPGSVQTFHNGRSNANVSGWGVSNRAMWRDHTFHDGKLYCMMVKVLIYLTSVVTRQDGPFCFVEGSHKANYPLPCTTEQIHDGTAFDLPGVSVCYRDAGDALILNEALTHGTLPKSSEPPRIVMAFSYAPSFVTNFQELPPGTTDIWTAGFCE